MSFSDAAESSEYHSELREETITWDVNYSSAFILTAEKTSVEGQEELYVFDSEDLINGIGGALGLFLGWSILYLGTSLILGDRTLCRRVTTILFMPRYWTLSLVMECLDCLPVLYIKCREKYSSKHLQK